jgi:hypothetical protein
MRVFVYARDASVFVYVYVCVFLYVYVTFFAVYMSYKYSHGISHVRQVFTHTHANIYMNIHR